MKPENKEFLTTQLITYLGNKRLLIKNIEAEVEIIKDELQKEKLVCADLFSGSGIAARMLKRHSKKLIVNDIEYYSAVINGCYLTNKKEYPEKICSQYRKTIVQKYESNKTEGIIARYYAPKNDNAIQKNERVFYTRENAVRIDTYRKLIDEVVKEEALKKYFLAPLITEASIHVNTSGVFKGFYKDKNTGIGCFGGAGKNALSRILGTIELKAPVFSNYNSHVEIYTEDAVQLAQKICGLDIAYLDPPYNQHPYGSNYFMLNLIIKNRLDVPISRVSGITQNWNRSAFNKKSAALRSLETLINRLDARYIIVSYNSEGFITFGEMTAMLKKYGSVKTVEIRYNTFRGSRNLNGREIHVSEYLFVLTKTENSVIV